MFLSFEQFLYISEMLKGTGIAWHTFWFLGSCVKEIPHLMLTELLLKNGKIMPDNIHIFHVLTFLPYHIFPGKEVLLLPLQCSVSHVFYCTCIAFSLFKLLILCVWVFCLHECMCTTCASWPQRPKMGISCQRATLSLETQWTWAGLAASEP